MAANGGIHFLIGLMFSRNVLFVDVCLGKHFRLANNGRFGGLLASMITCLRPLVSFEFDIMVHPLTPTTCGRMVSFGFRLLLCWSYMNP